MIPREIKWYECEKKPIRVHWRPVSRINGTKNDWEFIQTREGVLKAKAEEDIIIQGVEGEEYPCKIGTFKKTYRVCTQPSPLPEELGELDK